MTITESRVRTGLLTLDGTNFACQATAVSLTPSYSTSGDPVETLCGDTVLATTTESWELDFTAIQDFEDPDGIIDFSWDHSLETVPFVWVPNTNYAKSYSGTVQVQALDVGGDVNTRLTSDAAWPIQDGPERGNNTPATGATAGMPGVWTPAGSSPVANLAAMSAVTADPDTAWTSGQYVRLLDGTDAYWDGTTWLAGRAA